MVGAVKLYPNGIIQREIKAIRDKHKFTKEIKFSRITKASLPFYFDIVELMGRKKVQIGASVYDSHQAFDAEKETWDVQTVMAAKLIAASVSRNEFTNVFIDNISTPADTALSLLVTRRVRQRLTPPIMVKVYELDSRSTDLLQLADLVAGAVAHYRKHRDTYDDLFNPKAQVAKRLKRVYDLPDFEDVRRRGVNILTMNNTKPFDNLQ